VPESEQLLSLVEKTLLETCTVDPTRAEDGLRVRDPLVLLLTVNVPEPESAA